MPRPPNVLVIMTDQFRADHVGWSATSRLATPQLDRIAAGTAFSACWTPNPICQPARAALLTGKYSSQIGLTTMSGDLSPQHPTWPRALQAAGYRTAMVGKGHWWQGWDWFGRRPGDHPVAARKDLVGLYGWDEMWEAAGKTLCQRDRCDWRARLEADGLWPAYREHLARCRGHQWTVTPGKVDVVQPWPLPEELQIDRATTDVGLERLDGLHAQGKPWALFLSLCGPHEPYDPLPRHLAAHADEPRDQPFAAYDPDAATRAALIDLRRAYAAMIDGIDEQVGRVLDRLDSLGLASSTMVAFTADHGEMLGDHGHLQKALPYWQSARIPLAIRHPDGTAGLRCDEPVELTDLTATIIDAAGLDQHQALGGDGWPSYHDRLPGRSLLPVLRGEAAGVRSAAWSESDRAWHDASGYEPWTWQLVAEREWVYARHHRRPGHGNDDDAPWYEERLWHLPSDPDQCHDRSADPGPEAQAALIRLRDRRDRIVTQHPPAQTGWAPLVRDP